MENSKYCLASTFKAKQNSKLVMLSIKSLLGHKKRGRITTSPIINNLNNKTKTQ